MTIQSLKILNLARKEFYLLGIAVAVMLVYFLVATPVITDDGFHYEGFTEVLAQGKLNFKSFYGFQGLSFFAVLVFWLTSSHDSIIITSAIFSLLSVPLAYFVGKTFYRNSRAGIYFLILFFLTPYPYTTMMRGFQEAALLFFILLIIYGSLGKKVWTPVAWAVGGIVKPFALVLAPLFLLPTSSRRQSYRGSSIESRQVGNVDNRQSSPGVGDAPLRELAMSVMGISRKRITWLVVALIIGGLYLGASYYQTGHLVNNAAINSYQGNFDTGNPPPLVKSFTVGIKGYLRVGANLLLHFRKIMISPLVIVLGALSLLLNKNLRMRKEIILAIALNLLLVGSLTFSFSKYILPMTTLFALASVGYLLKYKWLAVLVFIDSFFVFMPIWNYFGHNYWSNIYLYLIPFWLALALFVYESRTK